MDDDEDIRRRLSVLIFDNTPLVANLYILLVYYSVNITTSSQP
jgi:hypothetical protein